MKSYNELQAEIKKLQAEAEQVRQSEIQSAIDEIKEKMSQYGITMDDLSPSRKARKPGATGTVKPKYRNPESGDTWTGRGKPPRWIAGKDKEQYLIK
ncbi:H-NS histone family protein [Lacisediminimonas profundi]|uniref:H-NS histone family protein n=1 Tax=Lacisediminimonas profundi TaxID=2603856 RepID=UPI00124B75E7|nr:H-NS histone family protein [Lacisediminimonas profundi]